MTRRISRIALTALLIGTLSGCGVSLSQTPGAVAGGNFAGLPTANGQGSEAGFRNWVMAFRPRALAAGVSPGTFDGAMAGAHYQPGIVALDGRQSEFSKQIWEYLDGAVGGARTSTGREMAARHARAAVPASVLPLLVAVAAVAACVYMLVAVAVVGLIAARFFIAQHIAAHGFAVGVVIAAASEFAPAVVIAVVVIAFAGVVAVVFAD